MFSPKKRALCTLSLLVSIYCDRSFFQPEEEILAEEPERRDHLLEKVKSMHRLTSNERSILSRLTSPTPNRLVSPAPPTRKRHSSGLQGSKLYVFHASIHWIEPA